MRIVEITTCHRPDDTRIYQKYVLSLLENSFNILYIAPSNFICSNDKLKSDSIKPSSFVLIRLIRIIMKIPKIHKFNSNFIHIHDPELLLLYPLFKILRFKIIYDMHENFLGNSMIRISHLFIELHKN